MLGPPRLSKLLFEAAILRRVIGGGLPAAAGLDEESVARAAGELIGSDADLRTRILSIGLPILLPDGRSVLRGAEIKVRPEPGVRPEAERLIEAGWVDLRPSSWVRWRRRAAEMLASVEPGHGAEAGSRRDLEGWQLGGGIRPGALAAWVFRHEDRGERIKR
jgi:hypothetical protein